MTELDRLIRQIKGLIKFTLTIGALLFIGVFILFMMKAESTKQERLQTQIEETK